MRPFGGRGESLLGMFLASNGNPKAVILAALHRKAEAGAHRLSITNNFRERRRGWRKSPENKGVPLSVPPAVAQHRVRANPLSSSPCELLVIDSRLRPAGRTCQGGSSTRTLEDSGAKIATLMSRGGGPAPVYEPLCWHHLAPSSEARPRRGSERAFAGK